MPNFDTPQPITATVEISAGTVRLVASDRDDTVVEVRPRDESRHTTSRPPNRCASTSTTARLP